MEITPNTQTKPKFDNKKRICNFTPVTEPSTQKILQALVKTPGEATHFIFWTSKENPNEWGLTLRHQADTTDKYTSSHPTWKVTWYYENDKLNVAKHCESLSNNIDGENFDNILSIYNRYKKKK